MTLMSRVRTAGEALLFYLIFLLVVVVLSAMVGGLGALLGAAFSTVLLLGNLLAVLFCVGLGVAMLRGKGHLGEPGYWGLIVLAGLLALFVGGFLGLVPLAFFSTRPNGRVASYASVEGEADWQRDTDVPLDKL